MRTRPSPFHRRVQKAGGKGESPHSRLWINLLVPGVLVIALAPMFQHSRSVEYTDMKEGSISTRRVIAPFNFEILKSDEEYQADVSAAQSKIFPVFVRHDSLALRAQAGINAFFDGLNTLRATVYDRPERKTFLIDSLFSAYALSEFDSLARAGLADPYGPASQEDLYSLHKTVIRNLRESAAAGILDTGKEKYPAPENKVVVIDGAKETIVNTGMLLDLQQARLRAAELLRNAFAARKDLWRLAYALIHHELRPNLVFDPVRYEKRMSDARASVPLSSGFVFENERIVDRNERITPEIRMKLVSLSRKMAERGGGESVVSGIFPFLARIFFIAAVLFLLAVFIRIHNPDILRRTKNNVLIALILLLVCGFAFLIYSLEAPEYLVPSALGAMLLATLFNASIGYAVAAVTSVLVGGIWGNEFNIMAVSFIAGVVGVITITRVRDRRQIIQAILILAVAYMAMITAMGFIRFHSFREILRQWPWGILNGFFTPIIAYGLLPLIESVFDISTDFSLLELSSLNHPLLKRLSVEASGTYNHSVIMGNLAEAGSQAVGANSLLARVGSYYHDIGKIEKAEYFVENQREGENPHEKLNPRMSSLILMNHVKKGLEIAEKYRLPLKVKEIIGQHHGTTVMAFFHQKARHMNGDRKVSEEEYRYSGPRPQTKEAAICMLADMVEASTRSQKTPTHSRIKGLIEDIVDQRFREGQLDESPLTLRDLEKIKEAFLTILSGMFHTRIEYPEAEEKSARN